MSLRSDYGRVKSDFEELEKEAKYILQKQLTRKKIKYYAIPSRIKTFKSFEDKTIRKELSKPLQQIKDILGIRVICLLRSDLARISKLIKQSFDVVEEDCKWDTNEISTFGYLSSHLIARLPQKCSGPRYDHLKKLRFEIQLRTLAMDAWATLSHYLDYKKDVDVPTELKKDFYALSGLFYVADTHFDLFYKQRELEKRRIRKGFLGKSVSSRELNLDTLNYYLSNRFPGRIHLGLRYTSDLLYQLSLAGYRTILELETDIKRGFGYFCKYERKHPPAGGKYLAVGVVRVILSRVNPKFRKIRHAHVWGRA